LWRDKFNELKFRMSFPIQQYLEMYYPDGKLNSTDQFMASCPHCAARCLDAKGKFYYDTKKFVGLCQRCKVTGPGGGFRSLIGLIMFTEGIDYEKAVERIKSTSSMDDIAATIVSEITKFRTRLTDGTHLSGDDYLYFPIDEDIPMRRDLHHGSVYSFFSNRARSMPVRILDLFPAYFSAARFLQGRLVFEIKTNNSRAWLAYAMEKNISPKTLNPRGNILSCMLGGYDYFKKDEQPLLIVEGIFDLFRCIIRGYNVVCTFGNKVSVRQLALLNATKATELVLCYDSDVKGFGWKGMWAVMKKWRNGFSKPVSMMFMERMKRGGRVIDTDPDIINHLPFKEAYETRRLVA